MFSIPDPCSRRGDPLSRREWLRVGGIGLGGLSLAELAARSPARAAGEKGGSFGRAKSVIVFGLLGGPPQHETWDPKPDASEEIRGAFGVIPSRTPGLFVGELMPRTAQLTDRIAVLRAMVTNDNSHSSSGYQMLTGVPPPAARRGERHPQAAQHVAEPRGDGALPDPRSGRAPLGDHAAGSPLERREHPLAGPGCRRPRPAPRPLADPLRPLQRHLPGAGDVAAGRCVEGEARRPAVAARSDEFDDRRDRAREVDRAIRRPRPAGVRPDQQRPVSQGVRSGLRAGGRPRPLRAWQVRPGRVAGPSARRGGRLARAGQLDAYPRQTEPGGLGQRTRSTTRRSRTC